MQTNYKLNQTHTHTKRKEQDKIKCHSEHMVGQIPRLSQPTTRGGRRRAVGLKASAVKQNSAVNLLIIYVFIDSLKQPICKDLQSPLKTENTVKLDF